MTKREKKRLVRDILKGFSKTVDEKIDQLPEDWDGFEIKQWIGDLYMQTYPMRMDKKREKEYKNTVLVKNLV